MKKQNKKQITFMIGSPASGKSTVADKIAGDKYEILDCDKIKESHPDYDPKNPHLLHEWSARELEKRFQKAIKKEGQYILDGTGSNSDKLIRRITEARQEGFVTKLVYVTCSLKECLRRNQTRERVVPENVVKEKYKDINYSFQAVSPHADKVEVINNE